MHISQLHRRGRDLETRSLQQKMTMMRMMRIISRQSPRNGKSPNFPSKSLSREAPLVEITSPKVKSDERQKASWSGMTQKRGTGVSALATQLAFVCAIDFL